MDYLKDLLTVLGFTAFPYLAYLHRKIMLITDEVTKKLENKDMIEYVDLKIKPDQVKIENISEDIKEIKELIKEVIRASKKQ